MPVFEITDPNTGQTLELEGESPPTEAELEQIFAELGQSGQPSPQAAPADAQAAPAGQPAPAPAPAPADPNADKPGFLAEAGREALGLGEAALTFGSSVLAEPLAGFAGIFGTIFGDEKGEGAANVEGTRKALTFQPRSKEGKINLEDIANSAPVKNFIEILTAGEQKLGELGFKIAGPAGGAFGASIPTAVLEALGLVSLKKLRLGKADLVTPDGKPSAELFIALEKSGVDFDTLSPEAIDELKGIGQVRGDIPGFGKVTSKQRETAQVTEAARAAQFQEADIPFTKGDVSQDFVQQAKEQRLLSMTGDVKSEPLRQLKLAQSEAFIKRTDELVSDLGGTAQDGEVLKGALEGRLKLLKKEKNDLYNQFAETSPELKNLPIITDTLADAMADRQTSRRIGRLVPGPAKALDDLLVEFGIKKDPDIVDEFLKAGDEITPLDIGNFEDFRQGINAIERSDQTGTISNLTGPIKRALDAEGDLVDSAVRGAGITDESVLAPLKKARETVRQIKTEFSPESITGKLIKIKKDGVTPVVEASKVMNEVLAPNKPIEFLERTLDSLAKSGKKGKEAIESMQAATVMKALDDALSAPTRKTGGIETIGANSFDKSLRKFGDDKLKLLFRNNPGALKRLKKLQTISKNIVPTADATPKGSAPVLLDLAKKLQRVPGLSKVFDAMFFIAENDRKAVNIAIKAKPSFSRSVKLIKSDFPNIATALGIGKISGEVQKEAAQQLGVQVNLPGRESQVLNPETGQLEPGTVDE